MANPIILAVAIEDLELFLCFRFLWAWGLFQAKEQTLAWDRFEGGTIDRQLKNTRNRVKRPLGYGDE